MVFWSFNLPLYLGQSPLLFSSWLNFCDVVLVPATTGLWLYLLSLSSSFPYSLMAKLNVTPDNSWLVLISPIFKLVQHSLKIPLYYLLHFAMYGRYFWWQKLIIEGTYQPQPNKGKNTPICQKEGTLVITKGVRIDKSDKGWQASQRLMITRSCYYHKTGRTVEKVGLLDPRWLCRSWKCSRSFTESVSFRGDTVINRDVAKGSRRDIAWLFSSSDHLTPSVSSDSTSAAFAEPWGRSAGLRTWAALPCRAGQGWNSIVPIQYLLLLQVAHFIKIIAWSISSLPIWKTLHNTFKKRHPTPVLLPGKSHGWRSLVGCSPWGR